MKGDVEKMLFKWADNSTLTGNVMEFMDRGDTAPNDRYAYQYIGSAGNTTTIDYVMEDANGKLYALRDEWAALGKLTVVAAMPVLIAFGVCMLRKNKRESE